jgi:hypothetical protein
VLREQSSGKNFAITFVLCKLQIIFLQNIISDCLKPIYNILRAFGVFPLSRRSELSEFRFHVQSPAMAYSFAVFVVLIVSSCAMLFLFMRKEREEEGHELSSWIESRKRNLLSINGNPAGRKIARKMADIWITCLVVRVFCLVNFYF